MALGTETLRQSLRLVVRQPGRSILTMIGLAIGVGAFIAMVSFGEGARRTVMAQFTVLGANVLKIYAEHPGGRPPEPLFPAEVQALRREATTIAAVIPVGRRTAGVAGGGKTVPTTFFGVTPEYTELHGWAVASGGMFDATDVEQRTKVCVLGNTPAQKLFGDDDPLGQTVVIAGTLPCRVIGVLEHKGYSTSGSDLDDIALVPTFIFETHVSDRRGFAFLEVVPVSPSLMDASREEVKEILRRVRRLRQGEPDDFSVSSPGEVIKAADETSRILSTLLAAIAGVSLLVGGIGIMNIQLVSVAERTREIGTRAAIGASPTQILTQFLIEAFILALIGTLAGVALGVGVASGVASVMHWPRVISPEGILLSSGFGLGVGVFFGFLPARRAAMLDPIQALRHE